MLRIKLLINNFVCLCLILIWLYLIWIPIWYPWREHALISGSFSLESTLTYIWLLLWFTDWISDVIISRSNSSYLKVTFDVKSRNVKWYAVELWDSLNNLIKSERTGKVYIGDISEITQRRFLLFKLSGQLFHVDWFCARYEK